jgi:hypothetical protein
VLLVSKTWADEVQLMAMQKDVKEQQHLEYARSGKTHPTQLVGFKFDL